MHTIRIKSILVGTVLASVAAGPVAASELRMGIKADPTVDPHFLYLATNIAIARHMFDHLLYMSPTSKPQPGLAISWKAIDDTTWEFKLRPGIKFSDGSDFDAADVLFSLDRVKTLPNNPNPYTSSLRSVTEIIAPDPMTVRFKTSGPNPEFPTQMRNVAIVSSGVGTASPSDFVSGKATIGTGPYKFVSFTPGERLVLKRNDKYWGPAPAYENVTFRVMTNDASRVAALLAGDVDGIDVVPPTDIARLKKDKNIKIFSSISDRTMYLSLNATPERLENASDNSGKPLDKNPMKDHRVRLAIYKAVNRDVLVTRGLEGFGVPAGQMVPEGFPGYNPAIKAEKADIAGAKKLLAEAGYPEGLALDLLCPNGRYVNDAAVCQMIGAMLSRVGIKAKVEAFPPAVFFPKIKVPDQKPAIMLIGWGLGAGTALTVLNDVLRTYDKEKGTGANNRGAHDPELDRIVDEMVRTLDDKKRVSMMVEALGVAKKNTDAVPLYNEMTVMAARKGVVLIPRYDQQTSVVDAHPAK